MPQDINIDGNSIANKMMGNGIRDEKTYSQKGNKYKSGKNQNGKSKQSGRHNSGKTDGFSNSKSDTRYVGAPYNFVPFTSQVYEYPAHKQVWHDDTSKELLTGEIVYEITAKTPIIIDDGKGNFYKTAYGTYAIPGSSVRGLIRNNVQILGLSSFSSDIDDYELMYRNVASGIERKRYGSILGAATIPVESSQKSQKISVLKNVKAGYIANENGNYKIYQTVVNSIKKEYGDMNYYVLSERKIIDEYLDLDEKGKEKFPYDIFVHDEKSIMQHTFQSRFVSRTIKGRKHYIGNPNKDYKPYYFPVSYEIKDLKNIQAVGEPGRYKNNGYVISSGAMNEKKAIYIIPEICTEKEAVTVSEEEKKLFEESILSFKIDYKKKENSLKQSNNQDFFNLPKEGEIKPVFYIRLDGRLYFGFTPRLRLFYDHNIKYGLPDQHAKQILDYSSAIFGYSTDKKSFKSKVYFLDAKAVGEPTEQGLSQEILAEPKPTSYLDYLIQDDADKIFTYNTDGMRLRGVKQYWLHKNAHPQEVDPKKNSVATSFHPLKKGSRFIGNIRYKNMTPDELGLLLWSIQLEPGKSRMNIGKAKPFGYGNITMKITSVKKLDKDKAYASESFELDPFVDVNVEETIQIYKDYIKQEHLGGKEIDQLPSIQNFLLMKNPEIMPDEAAIRYMSIDRKEYQNRKQPLPFIKETICKKGKGETNG